MSIGPAVSAHAQPALNLLAAASGNISVYFVYKPTISTVIVVLCVNNFLSSHTT